MKELIAIQAELKAPKGQTNKFGGYKYRSCEDILEAVKPLLQKYNAALTLTDDIIQIGGDVFVKATATFYAESSAPVAVSAFARHPKEKKGMDDSQITGAASSYARKYALNGLFCIDDTRDADTNEYSATERNKQQAGQFTNKSPTVNPTPSTPAAQPIDKIGMMLKFMESIGVSREEIEREMCKKMQDINNEDIRDIRDAAKIMMAKHCTFHESLEEVTR